MIPLITVGSIHKMINTGIIYFQQFCNTCIYSNIISMEFFDSQLPSASIFYHSLQVLLTASSVHTELI